MFRARTLTLCLSVFVIACSCVISFEQEPSKDRIPNDLLGTWQQVVAQTGNQIHRPDAAGAVKQLHITSTHFNRVVHSPKTKQLQGVVGGRYSFSGGNYVETIDYADEASRKAAEGQKPMRFAVDIKEETLVLKLVDPDTNYSEVWKRVK
jgi:hypothetical protein